MKFYGSVVFVIKGFRVSLVRLILHNNASNLIPYFLSFIYEVLFLYTFLHLFLHTNPFDPPPT